MGTDEVSTLVSPSLNNISPINDNCCVGPTPIQENQVQLDPQSTIEFSRAQNVNKLVSKTVSNPVVSKTINPVFAQTLKLDVSCHAVTHAHIVPLSSHQSMNKIKHVKGVCCVHPCLSVPHVPNVPNAVIEQNVGGR